MAPRTPRGRQRGPGAAAGTRSGKIVVKSTSLDAGEGTGTTADPHRLTGARPNRPMSVLAAQYRAAGVPMYDRIVCGDQGMSLIPGYTLPMYDPRVIYPGTALGGGDQHFAGGSSLNGADATYGIGLTEYCDGFDLDFYAAGGNVPNFYIDGALPPSGPTSYAIPATLDGFGRVHLTAAGLGNHALGFAFGSTGGNIYAIRPVNSTQKAIDIIVHAVEGARATDQAATSSNHWYNLDALAYEAPDATYIELGTNELFAGIGPAATASTVQSIINTAKASGNVLLGIAHPINPAKAADSDQQAMNAALKSLATSNNVACISHYDNFGSYAAISQYLYDGVHWTAAGAAMKAANIHQALELMAV